MNELIKTLLVMQRLQDELAEITEKAELVQAELDRLGHLAHDRLVIAYRGDATFRAIADFVQGYESLSGWAMDDDVAPDEQAVQRGGEGE